MPHPSLSIDKDSYTGKTVLMFNEVRFLSFINFLMQFMCRGAVLSNESSVGSYHIESGHTLHMVAKPIDYLERQERALGPRNSRPNDVVSSSANESTPTGSDAAGNNQSSSPGLRLNFPEAQLRSTGAPLSTNNDRSFASLSDAIFQSILSDRRSNDNSTSVSTNLASNSSLHTAENFEHIRQGILSLQSVHHTILSRNSNVDASRTSGEAFNSDEGLTASRVRYSLGQWVDVKDTVNQWLEATIMALDESAGRVFVHYNGW